jgi:glutamyl/glutaminyl-tRNA synthetase
MTEQEQQIAIAKHVGYPNPRMGAFNRCYAGDIKNLEKVPHYPSDLNAMHEAVMKLDRKTLAYSNYCSNLQQIVAIQNSKSNEPGIQAIDATAAQRAEAFLRTLNLWKP